MQLVLLFAIVFVGGLVALGSWYFSSDQQTLRAMKAVPLLPVADVTADVKVRIKGVAEVDECIQASLTGRACACWRVVIHERRGTGKNFKWVTVVDEQESRDFALRDGKQKALIRTEHSTLVLDQDWKFSSGAWDHTTPELEAFLADRGLTSSGFVVRKRMQFAEGVVENGELVAVVGVGSWERDTEQSAQVGGYREAIAPRLVVVTNPVGEMRLLSDLPKTLAPS